VRNIIQKAGPDERERKKEIKRKIWLMASHPPPHDCHWNAMELLI
jgi:hypothetical protein